MMKKRVNIMVGLCFHTGCAISLL